MGKVSLLDNEQLILPGRKSVGQFVVDLGFEFLIRLLLR
jgi:hypothetical protein